MIAISLDSAIAEARGMHHTFTVRPAQARAASSARRHLISANVANKLEASPGAAHTVHAWVLVQHILCESTARTPHVSCIEQVALMMLRTCCSRPPAYAAGLALSVSRPRPVLPALALPPLCSPQHAPPCAQGHTRHAETVMSCDGAAAAACAALLALGAAAVPVATLLHWAWCWVQRRHCQRLVHARTFW